MASYKPQNPNPVLLCCINPYMEQITKAWLPPEMPKKFCFVFHLPSCWRSWTLSPLTRRSSLPQVFHHQQLQQQQQQQQQRISSLPPPSTSIIFEGLGEWNSRSIRFLTNAPQRRQDNVGLVTRDIGLAYLTVVCVFVIYLYLYCLWFEKIVWWNSWRGCFFCACGLCRLCRLCRLLWYLVMAQPVVFFTRSPGWQPIWNQGMILEKANKW